MSVYVCPICGRRLEAMNEDNLRKLVEVHMRGHDLIESKTPREQLIQVIKNRIKSTKMNIERLERELKEQKGILKILYKSLQMLEVEK